MSPSERVALVTGAARGIGAATTRRLADDGYRVMAVDWCAGEAGPYPQASREDLEAVAAPYAGRVVTITGDVRERRVHESAVAAALEKWGRLDAVVAAAAVILGGQALWEAPEGDLDMLWDIDVKGVWYAAAASVPAMLSGPDPSGCRFVAVASAAGTHGLFHLAAYNTAKHAVVGLVKSLAADLAGTGITAAAVSPGSTDTRMLAQTAGLYGVGVSELVHHQLTHRLIAPEEVASAIVFCCSRHGGVVNGTVLHADGGFRP